MIPFLSRAAIASLIFLQGCARAADETKSVASVVASVKVQEPKRGTIPEMVYAHGTAVPSSGSTVTASFQRDGRISDIMVEVGDQYKIGDTLLDFGASPAAKLAYEQAKTALTLAERSLARTNQLFKQQLATREQVETAEKAVSDAKLMIEMLEKIGSIRESELLLAPFDGVVTTISVTKGDRIAAGAPLMTLSRTDQMILSVGVEQGQVAKVKAGLPVNLESLRPGRKPAEGKVRRVGAAVDPKMRLVPVTIDIAAGGALAGEAFRAGIVVGKFQGWVVPRDAVGNDKKGAFVFQIDEGHARRVDVNVVGSVGKTSVIEGEISSQREIILAGKYQIADGDAVQPEEAPPAEEEEEG